MGGTRSEGFQVLGRTPAANFERLSPAAMFAFMAGSFIPILLVASVLAFIGALAKGAFLFVFLAAAVLLLLADFVYSWLYISNFVFTMENPCFLVRKGAIIYSHTLIPYENIQDIHLVQSLTDRIFGVWSVLIFTATATEKGSEQVIGLSKESAEKLKEAIFLRIKEVKHVTD